MARVERGTTVARRGRHAASPKGQRGQDPVNITPAEEAPLSITPAPLPPDAAISDTSVPLPQTRPPRTRRKRRRGERILRVAVIFVAVVLVATGTVYGYLRYRLDQIHTLKCPACAAVADGSPYNVLVIGSDTRAGNTGNAASAFGTASQVGGQRSDTIKILHIDPAAGTARLLSIPRDTYVQLTGLPSNSPLSTDNKINAAYNYGPNALIQTIQATFGISISHFVILDFNGVIDLVNSLGGIRLDFPYPVRDDDNGNNNSGLSIPTAGCQNINGTQALALSRSRFYQYEVRPGYWIADGSGDLGRIQRQNALIEAVIDKARSTYNPLTLNAFMGSIVHDVTIDQGMSTSQLISLAQRYHAFSGSSLQTATLPTTGGYSSQAGDVEVVQEPAAQETIAQFLGTQPSQTLTAPLTAYGSPVTIPPPTTAPPVSSGPAPAPSAPAPGTGPFNPSPC
jgi:LCP family protein required for cell wall assembly